MPALGAALCVLCGLRVPHQARHLCADQRTRAADAVASLRWFLASFEAVETSSRARSGCVQRCALVCHKLARGAPSEGVGGFFLTLSRRIPRWPSLHKNGTFFKKANFWRLLFVILALHQVEKIFKPPFGEWVKFVRGAIFLIASAYRIFVRFDTHLCIPDGWFICYSMYSAARNIAITVHIATFVIYEFM